MIVRPKLISIISLGFFLWEKQRRPNLSASTDSALNVFVFFIVLFCIVIYTVYT